MAESSVRSAYHAVLRPKRKLSGAIQKELAPGGEVLEKDLVAEMGAEGRRVVKRLVQIARDEYSNTFDVVAAEKYQRRLKVSDPDKPFRGYAIIQRLVVDHEGKLQDTRLEIRSRKLCAVVKELAAHLRGQVNIDTIPIAFRRPFHALFFLYPALEKYLTTMKSDKTLKEEIELLLSFIKSPAGIKPVITAYSEQVELHKVSFGMLWSLFPPGAVVYSHDGITESCFVVESAQYWGEDADAGDGIFTVDLVQGYHDGERYGLVRASKSIAIFHGLQPISPENFTVVPLETIFPEQQRRTIRERLIQRGKDFCELQQATMSHRSYEGPFWEIEDEDNAWLRSESGRHIQIQNRVVVDSRAVVQWNVWQPPKIIATSLRKLYNGGIQPENDRSEDLWSMRGRRRLQEVNDESKVLDDGGKVARSAGTLSKDEAADQAHVRWHDEEYLICPPDIRCFFLAEQKWGKILVEHLSPVQWSEGAFDKLQMLESQKETIKTLVRGFDPQRDVDFDDVIQYKGRGLVFLLHGAPGLGKTFTAESIAEHAHLPLYHVTTGQLSNDVRELETELKAVFELGRRWKAVVLVDEADVLMAQRTENDLTRNAVVAVFLRLIEYYRGLLFLTTNRVQGLDTAFHNRIHVKIAYNQLAHGARTQIWRNLLTGSKVRLLESWPEEIFSILGQLEANGRDIRNILRIAHSLHYGASEYKSATETIISAIRINRSDQPNAHSGDIDLLADKLRAIAVSPNGKIAP